MSTGIATDGASTLTGLVARDAAPSVDVRNQSGTDLRVYAVMPNGRSVRLGLVPKLGAVTLALPKGIAFPTELTLVAVPLGHDDPQVMEPIKVDGGTRVLLRVAPHGGSSMVTTQP